MSKARRPLDALKRGKNERFVALQPFVRYGLLDVIDDEQLSMSSQTAILLDGECYHTSTKGSAMLKLHG